ncbi:GATA zinc finger domain-containing protein 12, partial [Aplysia californica]|uniref:GATA zinc finger domain-containing protein 12 n=1 Tax=Aplysia californica TaxID=6500 RepID=A0ABM1AEW1_APLCA
MASSSPPSNHGGLDAAMRADAGDTPGAQPSKRRKKQSDSSATSVAKADSPGIDPLTEQLNQFSAARILQELPRYNWLEQKILQRNSYAQNPSSSTTSATISASSATATTSVANSGAKNNVSSSSSSSRSNNKNKNKNNNNNNN